MKFFNDKQIISTLFTINLFNNVLADGYNRYMGHHEVAYSNPEPFVNNDAPQSQMFYSSNDSEVKYPPLEHLLSQDDAGKINPKPVGINMVNDYDESGEANNNSPPDAAETTTSAETTSSTSAIPTSGTTTVSSTTTTTTTTPTTTTTTVPTPKPTDPAPAPKPQNQFVAAIVTVIKSIFSFLWSHRGAIWNFFNTNILTPIWNWIKQKWFS